MTFHAPDIDYAGLSPVIALTAGICVVLLVGLFRLPRWVMPATTLGILGDHRRALHLAVGRAAPTWSRARCASTSSGWRRR